MSEKPLDLKNVGKKSKLRECQKIPLNLKKCLRKIKLTKMSGKSVGLKKISLKRVLIWKN